MKSLRMLVAAGCMFGFITAAGPVFAQHRGGNGHAGGGAAVRRGEGARAGGPAASPGRDARGPAANHRSYRGPGVYRGGYGAYRGDRGYRVVAPVHFLRPYYAFRPRVSLGFGIWAGYPFAYSYGFYDPFFYADGYAYPGPYPYPPASPGYDPSYPSPGYPADPRQSYPSSTYPPDSYGSVEVLPGQENMGGLSFDISPGTAQVFIDGRAVGTVTQFTPNTEPLGVVAGRHHVEIQATGYRALTFDVDIIAGQVIPYQGTLER